MKILGIDTVTRMGGLAVLEDGRILGETSIDMHMNHAAKIISSLDALLKSIKVNISDIGAIAVDTGPGSFTGIRVGIASALGLAQPDKKILIGICSLEALSCQRKEDAAGKILVPIIDAKRGAVYSAHYKYDGKEIKNIKKPYAEKIEAVPCDIPENSFVFGPDMTKFHKIIPEKHGSLVEKHDIYPSAGVIARIAERKIKEGYSEKNLEPMYIHDIELGK